MSFKWQGLAYQDRAIPLGQCVLLVASCWTGGQETVCVAEDISDVPDHCL